MAFRTHTATARAFDKRAKECGLTRSGALQELVRGYIDATLRGSSRATPHA